jgi:hypothetical protein
MVHSLGTSTQTVHSSSSTAPRGILREELVEERDQCLTTTRTRTIVLFSLLRVLTMVPVVPRPSHSTVSLLSRSPPPATPPSLLLHRLWCQRSVHQISQWNHSCSPLLIPFCHHLLQRSDRSRSPLSPLIWKMLQKPTSPFPQLPLCSPPQEIEEDDLRASLMILQPLFLPLLPQSVLWICPPEVMHSLLQFPLVPLAWPL